MNFIYAIQMKPITRDLSSQLRSVRKALQDFSDRLLQNGLERTARFHIQPVAKQIKAAACCPVARRPEDLTGFRAAQFASKRYGDRRIEQSF